MRFLVVFLCAVLGWAAPAPQPLIQNPFARKAFSLNGHWQAIVDPFDVGYYDYRYQPLPGGGFAQNLKPKDKTDRVEYDFDAAGRLFVPRDWNTQRPELFFYEGTIWYKRDFDYKLAPGRRLFLYFGSANYHAVVFLNGQKLGEHEGGFTPFNFEITSQVKPSGNFLIVRVNNQRKLDGVPTVNTDWWNYGGLTGDVWLLELPQTFIRDYLLQLAKGSTDRVQGWVQLDGPAAAGAQVRVQIPEANIEATARADASGRAAINIQWSPQLWSPENPKLYRVVISSGDDRVEDKIGFRTIETRGVDLLLNGKPIFLRGVDIHGEAPMRQGRGLNEADARVLLGWAKELNCNFVRLAHYPHPEVMTRMADEMGLLVWSEIPVYWTIQWENPRTYALAEQQLVENITRDKNRASIILWSVANETPISEARLSFLRRLIDKARELDPTRLVTAALERHYIDEDTQMIDDPLGQYLDVIGCNQYIGWYDGLPEKADRVQWRMAYEKPLIFSEFGGGALYGYHGDELTRWTEEFQRSIYEHQVRMFQRIPFLRGTSPWILVDFRSPRRPLARIQDFFNRKGLISDQGQKKQAFYVLQEFYRQIAEKWQ